MCIKFSLCFQSGHKGRPFPRTSPHVSILNEISRKGKTSKNTLTLEEQEEAKLRAEKEEEEKRLLELKDEEYELLDEDSLQVKRSFAGVQLRCYSRST